MTGFEPAPPIPLQTLGYDPELFVSAWALLPGELHPLVSHYAGTKRRAAVVDANADECSRTSLRYCLS